MPAILLLEELEVLSRIEGSLKSFSLNTTNGIIWTGRGREGKGSMGLPIAYAMPNEKLHQNNYNRC